MRGNRGWKVLGIVAMVVVAAFVLGFVVMQLWNWLMPAIFAVHRITFCQALGLLVLGKILFGGFHRHGGDRRGWKRHMEERWANMSPEEREKFREGMRGRRCGFGRRGDFEQASKEGPATTQGI